MTAWMSVGFDTGRLGALTWDVTETGGGGATATITLTGRYAHWITSENYPGDAIYTVDPILCDANALVPVTVGGYEGLGDALETALNTSALNGTYTVTFAPTTQLYTITVSGGGVTAFAFGGSDYTSFRMLGAAAVFSSTGTTWTTPTTYALNSRIAHFCAPDMGGWSQWEDTFADIEGEALIGSDGSARGTTALGSPRLADFVAQYEPLAKLRNDSQYNTTVTPGSTWQEVFSRARCVEPIWVSPPQDSDPESSGIRPFVGFMRPDAAALRPQLTSPDYLAVQSVPFGLYIVGIGYWRNQL